MRIGPWDFHLPSLRGAERAAVEAGRKVENVAEAAVDGFKQLERRIEADGVVNIVTGGHDAHFDGMLVGADGQSHPPSTPLAHLAALEPVGGPRNAETIIEINGVGCNLARQGGELRALADATGSRVIGLHNATTGYPLDAAQEVGDELRLGDHRAVDGLAMVVLRELDAGRSVHLVGHSQGAVVTARALEAVKASPTARLGSAQAAENVLAKVTVETFGGAAWAYPDGPRYRHDVNLVDPVPQTFGQGLARQLGLSRPGRGAELVTFTAPHPFHALSTYLQHRRPL